MTTLYDKYGGFSTVNKLVQTFYGKIAESENLAPYFDGIDTQKLMDHQTKFFSDILGGPVEYTGPQLKGVHAKMAITEDAFAEVAELLEETLELTVRSFFLKFNRFSRFQWVCVLFFSKISEINHL